MKQISTELSAACRFIRNGYVYDTKTNNGSCKVTRIETISEGLIDTSKVGWTPAEPRLTDYKLCRGDILLSHINSLSHLGKCAIFSSDEELYHGMNLLCLRVQDGWDPRFIFHSLRTSNAKNHFYQRAKKAVAQCSLNAGDIGELKIPSPPLPEQQKIADILGTWDEALEKLDALIVANDRRKQALMQQLLTGKRRQPGSAAWERVLLADVAEECGARNRERLDRTRLFAVTKAEGMVPMRENVQGATINRCKVVERGWFAYNPMRINIGSIARWEGAAPVMVSPDYVVFRANEDRLLSDYLNHVRRAAPWADFVGASGNGSVRVRIWFDDLGRFKLPLPPLAEQRVIADILDAADTEVCLLRQQRAALVQQKRGLKQQLLTSRVRNSI